MIEAIEISNRCYEDIEEWLEGVYGEYPFERIFMKGERLGYEGFIENFDLKVEKDGEDVIVRVVSKQKGETRHEAVFHTIEGGIYNGKA